VLPLFRRQLERGGPITVTHPEVTRYFMTIPEAAQLILQAGALGESGKIYVLEMGSPIKIAQMAEELVRLVGKEPGKDVEIVYTGLREGEKLYEELMYAKGEGIVGTKYEKIMVLQSHGRWNGITSQEEFKNALDAALEELYQITNTHDAQAIKRKLREILPEYSPQFNAKSVLKGSEERDHDMSLGPGTPGLLTKKRLRRIAPKKGLKKVVRSKAGISLPHSKSRV